MITALAGLGFALALLYAAMTLVNLRLLPGAPRATPANRASVSVLIPARDEAERIAATLERVLASRGVDLEVLVLDDHSSDATAAIVAELAARDPRLRLIRGAALPAGHNGKQHACSQLAAAAGRELLLFIDADVAVAPDGIARACAALERQRFDLVSGFPYQQMQGTGTMLFVPMIHVLLLGYLPLFFARLFNHPMFATGCGQFLLVRRAAYIATGGHATFIEHMHDGMRLPRLLRENDYRTGLVDATDLARCCMYRDFAGAWTGFAKDATEGMATPVGLPVWTLLLFGGHVLPILTLGAALIAAHATGVTLSLAAIAALALARLDLRRRTRQPWASVALHPAAVLTVLTLQWACLIRSLRGRPRTWRGRRYD